MIPFLEQPSVQIGPLTIHAFGPIVAAAVYAGLAVGTRRFARLGRDRTLGERLAWWAVAGGFLGAHLFSVVFYFPGNVAENPLVLLKLWEDISSFGSILGGLLGVWLFFRLRAPAVDRPTRWAYLDVVAFVFPISLMIGRVACSLAHDHPGALTTFPLAVSVHSAEAQVYVADVYRDAGRLAELPAAPGLAHFGFHDLGWYEFLYLAVLVVPVTLWLDRRPRVPGFFLATFIVLYMPGRFLLDFLRISDARYAGLTPAQWVTVLLLLALPVRWLQRRAYPHASGSRPGSDGAAAQTPRDAVDVSSPAGG